MSDTNRNQGAAGSGVSFDADLKGTGTKDVTFTPASGTTTTGSGPGGASASASTSENKVRGAAQTLKDEAGKIGRQATDSARGYVDTGKAKATGALDEFSKMIDEAASTVDEKLGAQYGDYARSAAQSLSGFSDQLRSKEVDELLDDVRGFVRKSPAVAVGIAAALGFVVARVVKSGIDAGTGTSPSTTTADRTPGKNTNA